MELRKVRPKVGDRVWIHVPSGDAPRGWAQGAEGVVISEDAEEIVPCVTMRDADGRTVTLRHFEVDAGWYFRGRGDWVQESDPRVLDWLEAKLAHPEAPHESESVARDQESRRAWMQELLRRNGR